MDVTLPNGQVIHGVPDGTTKVQLAAKLQANGMTVPKEWMASTPAQAPESALATQGKRLLGGVEGVGNTFLNMLSAPVQGIAGIGGGLKAIGANALNALGAPVAPENIGDTAQSAMQFVQNYTPQITAGGGSIQEGREGAQQGIGAITQVLPWLAEKGADFVNKEATQGNPRLIAALAPQNARLQALANIGANIAPGAFMPRGAVKSAIADEVSPFQTARELNLKIPPSYAAHKGGVTTAGPVIEGMVGGAPKAAVDASVANQPNITLAASKDIPNMEPSDEITPQMLDDALQPHYEAYSRVKKAGTAIPIDAQFKKMVSEIGNESSDAFPMDSSPALDKLKQAYLQPDSFGASGAVLKIRQLRKDAGMNIGSMDPEKVQLGYAQKKIATAIEDQIERYATSRPEGFEDPNLIKDFRNARVQIAKIETLRDAIRPGTNDVSAALLARMKNRGVPLSGNMNKIADLYNNFKPAMMDAAPLRNKVPVNRLDAMVGSAGAGIGAFKHSINPVLGAAGYILAPPLARKALLSEAYQNSMLPKPMNPEILKLLAPAAAQALFTGNNNGP